MHKEHFTTEFLDWLPLNRHIFEAFCEEAIKVRNRGFKHYSARTIVHVLRHHSALHEEGGEWKINDHISPYCARLFDLRFPAWAGLFEYREAKSAKRDNALPA